MRRPNPLDYPLTGDGDHEYAVDMSVWLKEKAMQQQELEADLKKARNPSLRLAVAQLQEACHEANKHWWKDNNDVDFRTNPLAFSNKLMLIVSEVAEAMEADRKNLPDDKLPHRHGREVELADALIRIFDLAGAYGLDLPGAVIEKMEYNASRADHKPENRKSAGGKSY